MLMETCRRGVSAQRAELFRAFAQRFGELRGILELGRQQHGEAIARDARREGAARQPPAQQLADLADDAVADVHAEVVIDDMQLVGIDVERAPGNLAIGLVDHRPHAMLEGLARVKTTHRIEAALDDAGGLARQDVPEARVAIHELRG